MWLNRIMWLHGVPRMTFFKLSGPGNPSLEAIALAGRFSQVRKNNVCDGNNL